jgi:hypothetical protein
VKGIQVCSNKGPGPLQRGDNHKNVKMDLGHLKIFSRKYLANFNQTWQKSSFGIGDSSVFQRRDSPSPRGDKSEIVKIH